MTHMKKFFILSLSLLPLFIGTSARADDSWQRDFYWSGGPWGFGVGSCFVIPLLLMIAFWVAVIAGIVYFVRWVIATGKRHEIKPEETALDILKKRYAKGEISREEFERMKEDIL